jgi:trehalose 6-phosphate synthase
LALLPRLLKESRPDLGVAHFWHIPWPTHEIFRICPWRRQILEGLLGNDLVGLQIQYHCIRFLECVDAELQVRVDRENQCIWHGDRVTFVRSFPIGTDAAGVAEQADSAESATEAQRLRRLLGPDVEAVVVGVDRLDYTKGIPERFEAIDRFLNDNPAWRGRFQYLGVAAPSRTHIRTYQELSDRVARLVNDINWRHGTDAWRPILLLGGHAGPATTRALYRLGHVCMVTSLHDGMNLVAKEYVAARTDSDGVLILSRFTGAARELTDALLVNPYDAAGMARAILAALEMSEHERRRRMQRMRARVFERNVFEWARQFLGEAARRAEAAVQGAPL